MKAREVLRVVSQYLARVEKEIEKAEKPLIAEGDPDQLEVELLEQLDGMIDLAQGEGD